MRTTRSRSASRTSDAKRRRTYSSMNRSFTSLSSSGPTLMRWALICSMVSGVTLTDNRTRVSACFGLPAPSLFPPDDILVFVTCLLLLLVVLPKVVCFARFFCEVWLSAAQGDDVIPGLRPVLWLHPKSQPVKSPRWLESSLYLDKLENCIFKFKFFHALLNDVSPPPCLAPLGKGKRLF